MHRPLQLLRRLATDCSFGTRSQLDLSLVSHEQIVYEAREPLFMSSEQAFDPTILPVGPSALKPLDVWKFDHSRWFDEVFVVGEPNDKPRRGRLMHNGDDPMCLALDKGLLEVLGHGESFAHEYYCALHS